MLRSGLMLALAGVLLPGAAAYASSLDKDTCKSLEEEQYKLEQTGVRTTMAKGPAWGKANLDADKLQQVRRLIEVDELVLFRCQGKPLVLLPSNVDADPLNTDPDGGKENEAHAAGAKDAAKAGPNAAAVKTDKSTTDVAKKAAAPAAKTTVNKTPPPADAKQAKSALSKEEQDKATTVKGADLKVAKPKAPPPKKKVDDAYRPPPINSGENPFGSPD
jgi:hypothetical protein